MVVVSKRGGLGGGLYRRGYGVFRGMFSISNDMFLIREVLGGVWKDEVLVVVGVLRNLGGKWCFKPIFSGIADFGISGWDWVEYPMLGGKEVSERIERGSLSRSQISRYKQYFSSWEIFLGLEGTPGRISLKAIFLESPKSTCSKSTCAGMFARYPWSGINFFGRFERGRGGN